MSGILDKPGAAEALADPTKNGSKKSPSQGLVAIWDAIGGCGGLRVASTL
jgi:hypothetical protein